VRRLTPLLGNGKHGGSPSSRGWAKRRLTFLYLCIGEEENTPTRKRVTWSESLEQRLGTAKTHISVLVYR
jgi:hypothetical protein